ncbi:SDR family NAD(P)-dependent oxidoreductase [Paenibacillus alkalitolerans]|uniref:SDR family NAD(P)-dependent oxidoreductase n=1 Tax=Paenibacillus alkalitolerans TaxID=2799335 RepID=UPI0018F73801|nr:SDR family oxidoreductase [Paenibacillus alkalitolerans]
MGGLYGGKTVLVTGGGSGLGRAIAISFLRDGAKVAICGRALEPLQETIALAGADVAGNALAVEADVSSPQQVRRFVDESMNRFRRVDVMINNAAVFEAASLLQTDLDAWNEQLAVNATGPLLMMQSVIPIMRAQRGGTIVNVTSSMAANGSGGFAAYGASKAALESLSRTAADEESEHGIKVALFNPGAISTGMHATGEDPATVIPKLLALI